MNNRLEINKKGVIGNIVTIFIAVLLIAAVVAMTFLFISQFKGTLATTASQRTDRLAIGNESIAKLNDSGYVLTARQYPYVSCTINYVNNATGGEVLSAANYTLRDCILYNATATRYANVPLNVSYYYDYASGTGFNAANATETAGYNLVGYLPMVFLALIFGVILIVVLRVVLPYLKIGGGGL